MGMRGKIRHYGIIWALPAILAWGLLLPGAPASAQEDVSDFTAAFQVFKESRDAYRTFDITPEDVIYGLPPGYALGPGDILQVVLTGMINDVLPVQVGPQGDIYVPPVGLLNVEGMTVGEMRDIVDAELSKYLINYDCDVQLVRARRISVYLIGQIRQPGVYLALAGTTAISLIQSAGTLIVAPVTVNFDETAVTHPYFRALTSGAGRRAEIWRDGERVTILDLAETAISGRAQGDIILQDGDAVFIPTNSHPVVVRGGVARPGTYEVRRNDTVFDLIAQAGGYRSMMMMDKVQVERRAPEGGDAGAEMMTLNLADPGFDPRSFSFEPGDILRVPEVKDRVYVLGAVWTPQAVDYHEGWNVLDYVAAVGGPVSPTDFSDIQIISFPLSEDQSQIRFDFKNLVDRGPVESVPIEPGDLIWVPWKNQPFYGPGLTNAVATVLGQTLSLLRIIKDIG
jgi:protein involved in polysaccharide export with SLBB domain